MKRHFKSVIIIIITAQIASLQHKGEDNTSMATRIRSQSNKIERLIFYSLNHRAVKFQGDWSEFEMKNAENGLENSEFGLEKPSNCEFDFARVIYFFLLIKILWSECSDQ